MLNSLQKWGGVREFLGISFTNNYTNNDIDVQRTIRKCHAVDYHTKPSQQDSCQKALPGVQTVAQQLESSQVKNRVQCPTSSRKTWSVSYSRSYVFSSPVSFCQTFLRSLMSDVLRLQKTGNKKCTVIIPLYYHAGPDCNIQGAKLHNIYVHALLTATYVEPLYIHATYSCHFY